MLRAERYSTRSRHNVKRPRHGCAGCSGRIARTSAPTRFNARRGAMWPITGPPRAHRGPTAGQSPSPPKDTFMTDSPASLYDFDALTIDGKPAPLASQRGKVVLIVNTASACGFTPQFSGLQNLWKTYAAAGLVVMGFPSNEFGGQDPGTDSEIASFCQLNYGVSFPMMSKVTVNGARAHPLWQWLTHQAPGILGIKAVKWNFTKFLVGRDGQVIRRYAPTDKPESIASDIEAALAA